MDVKALFRPTLMKIMLTFTLFVLSLLLIVIATYGFLEIGFISHQVRSVSFYLFSALAVSYVLASLIDHFIKSKKIKVLIASVSGILSIILAYVFIRTTMVVCDPVHVPNQCVQNCQTLYQNTRVSEEAAQKFQECIQNCGY